ncbi:hypothetical protein F8B43_4996 [Methylorubrum populi]|uniref:Uncharacterized protein n=1 Tax=Methylorubrum populi TaxID=223967 RepID=A0A833J261_9HYPH|nr:hypothetical protein F8B43_4996 [Methylorubrum populi]
MEIPESGVDVEFLFLSVSRRALFSIGTNSAAHRLESTNYDSRRFLIYRRPDLKKRNKTR